MYLSILDRENDESEVRDIFTSTRKLDFRPVDSHELPT